jgi:hypothetical protein
VINIKTHDISDRIKASTINDIIINQNPTFKTDNGFKIRLSGYLNEWNLKKKRYNDGIYYYGLRTKNPSNSNLPKNEIRHITTNNLI